MNICPDCGCADEFYVVAEVQRYYAYRGVDTDGNVKVGDITDHDTIVRKEVGCGACGSEIDPLDIIVKDFS